MTVRQVTNAAEIGGCARMMSTTSPWFPMGFTYEACLSALAPPDMRVHATFDGDGRQVAAFMATMARGMAGEPLLEFLCVREDLRGQGLGSALLDYFWEELFPDAANAYLFVSDVNPEAMRLYDRHGYRQVGALPNFNYERQTEFLLRKTRGPRTNLAGM